MNDDDTHRNCMRVVIVLCSPLLSEFFFVCGDRLSLLRQIFRLGETYNGAVFKVGNKLPTAE